MGCKTCGKSRREKEKIAKENLVLKEEGRLQSFEDSRKKISEGGNLSPYDNCPYCGQHKWYWCRRGCLESKDK